MIKSRNKQKELHDKNHRPKISVIVPVYNVEKYLERCLLSIINQTFKDIEIICIDDRTPDNSLDILRKFEEIDKRVRIIRHEVNLGLGGARNTGIKAARAEYIASVDSDDYAEPSMLEALWNGSENGRFDVVVCGFQSVDEEGKQIRRHIQKVEMIDPIDRKANPFNISNPSFWNKLWRKSLFVNNEIYFPNHIYFEDSATTPRIYKNIRNINFIGGVHYNYVIRTGTITNTISDKHLFDRWREVDTVKDYFYSKSIYTDHVEHFKDRIFSGYAYYADNIFRNNIGGEKETDKYLRHLLLMREAYLNFDDVARSMTLDEKMRTFNKFIPLNSNLSTFKINGTPSVKVVTIFSHENELNDCKNSIINQDYKNIDHVIFSNLGKHEAHHKLYNYIMENKNNANFFLKIDADMVLSDEKVVSDLVQMFVGDPELDHITFQCDDFLTGSPMWGVHMFSNRVSWKRNENGLFSDPKPDRPGKRRLLRKLPRSLVRHSPNPSDLQVFHFGAHRALKLVQRGYSVDEKRVDPMREHWKVLLDVWKQYKIEGDRRRLLVLLAADLVVEGKLGDKAYDYADESLLTEYDRYSKTSESDLRDIIEKYWKDDASQKLYFERAVGPEGLEKIAREEKNSIKPIASGNGAPSKPEKDKHSKPGNEGSSSLQHDASTTRLLVELENEIKSLEQLRASRKATSR